MRTSKSSSLNMSVSDTKKPDYEKEETFYSLEAKRIQYLLENVMEKLRFALGVGRLVEQGGAAVEAALGSTELGAVRRALSSLSWQAVERRAHFASLHSPKELELHFAEYKPGYGPLPSEDEYRIARALQLLYDCEVLRSLATHTQISEGAEKFLEKIAYLFETSLEGLKSSPEDACRTEDSLRKTFNRHSELSDYSSFAQEVKEAQFNRDISYFDERIKELRKFENSIEIMKEEAEDYIEQLQKETDQVLLRDIRSGEEKRKVILGELESGNVDMESLRKKHVEEERDIRIKRYKTEQQLISVLRMYDRDLIDRQTIYEDKKAALDQEKNILAEFQEKYDEQTEIHVALMAEKKEYEDRLVQGRLYEIRCKMAARKIQRCLKRYTAVAGIYKTAETRKTSKKAKKSGTK